MPRTRSLAWSELKIGLVTVFALFMATWLIFLLSGEGGFFWQRYSLKTVFPNVAGLKEGAPVRLAGVEVGSVTGVELVNDRVEVVVEIARDKQSLVTDMSIASLGSVSLLGEAAVDITASSRGTPIPEWGYIRAGAAAGSLTEVTTQAAEGIEELTVLLQDIRRGRGTIGRLITDEALYNQMNGLVAAAEDVVRNVGQGRGTLGRLANDPAAAKALEASLQNFEAVTARIKAGEGQSREAAERRCAGDVADVDDHQPRLDHRPHQPWRRDRGGVDQRAAALRSAEFDVRSARQGDERAGAGAGHRGAAAARSSAV